MSRRIKLEPIPRSGTWQTPSSRSRLSVRIADRADALTTHVQLGIAHVRRVATIFLNSGKPQSVTIKG